METPLQIWFNQALLATPSIAEKQPSMLSSRSITSYPTKRLSSSYNWSSPPSSPRNSLWGLSQSKCFSGRHGSCIIACCVTPPSAAASTHSETTIPQPAENTLVAQTPLGVAADSAVATSRSRVQSSGTEELSNFGDGLMGEPEVVSSSMRMEEEEENSHLLDPELLGILANIADMRRQNERLGERMRDIHELVGKTTRSLNAKAKEAKVEDSKLKKLARSHQIVEIRRAEDMRKKLFEARMQMGRSSRILGRVRTPSIPIADTLSKSPMTRDALPFPLDPGDQPTPAEEGLDGSSAVAFPKADEDKAESSHPQSQLEGVAQHESVEISSQSQEVSVEPKSKVVDSESQECVVHPGAVSCTKTVITSDPVTKSVVVLMETTVRRDDQVPIVTTLCEEDYVALAVQMLADTAEDLKQSRIARARDTNPARLAKHEAILDLLENGSIVEAKPMEPPSQFGHENIIVKLLNNRTGEQIDTLFKPGIEGNAEGWHRAAIEMVAYKLNLILGMDLVPPAIYRSGGVDVNYRHYEDGAFLYFVQNTKPLRKVPATIWGMSVAVLLTDTRILDVLLNNSDRHHGNFLFGEHWADGKMRPVLIDHAAGFRMDALVKMEHENAFQTGPTRCVSAKTYLRLRFLDKQILMSTFEGILSEVEVNGLMERRNLILSYLDGLVQERGYHRVVIET